jgi:hypothetical protein
MLPAIASQSLPLFYWCAGGPLCTLHSCTLLCGQYCRMSSLGSSAASAIQMDLPWIVTAYARPAFGLKQSCKTSCLLPWWLQWTTVITSEGQYHQMHTCAACCNRSFCKVQLQRYPIHQISWTGGVPAAQHSGSLLHHAA